jgi:hypothetical protein
MTLPDVIYVTVPGGGSGAMARPRPRHGRPST